jgi:hypothetical protein
LFSCFSFDNYDSEEEEFEMFEAAWHESFGSGFDEPLRRKRAFDDTLRSWAVAKPSAAAAVEFLERQNNYLVNKVLVSLEQNLSPD